MANFTPSSNIDFTAKSEKPDSQGQQRPGDAIIDIISPTTTAVNSDLCKSALPIAAAPTPSAAQSAIQETITASLEDYQNGYPRQAAFQSSEPSFSIYRAFNYLHSRVLLELQDELRCLEDKLSDLDKIDFDNGDEKRLKSRTYDLRQARREKTDSKRAQLISAIRDKLVSYDEVLLKAREMNVVQRPSKRDYRSLRTWFWNEAPLDSEREEEFIKRKEDLISLRNGREWGGFDGFIEDVIRKLHCSFIHKLFATPDLRQKSRSKYIYFYSPSRIATLVNLILTFTIFVLLVLPVVAMYKLTSFGGGTSTFNAIGVLVVFTLLFSAAMSILTKAARHELFAASAAYCAVLVVFISNFGGRDGGLGVGGIY